jgi:sulfite dehydrogenase (quinone) subunit SoeC
MHPAFSILFFTTLAGTGQGLLVLLALALLTGLPMAAGFVLMAVGLAEVLLLAGLAASFLHLGHKMRAWRAVLMWRTSWMSREVILLPIFIALVALWWLVLAGGGGGALVKVGLPVLVLLCALALWYCTAMIYACLRFIQEWAHPLTIVNFILIGLSAGLVLGCALAALASEQALLRAAGPWAFALTWLAWAMRRLTLRRNSLLRQKSTLQSATGIRSERLVQKSMGMSAGSFNTREFFHGASAAALRHVRLGFQVLAFGLPVLLMSWGMLSASPLPWLLAALVQAPGLLAERWLFFAQAKHPQNLYYQTVS